MLTIPMKPIPMKTVVEYYIIEEEDVALDTMTRLTWHKSFQTLMTTQLSKYIYTGDNTGSVVPLDFVLRYLEMRYTSFAVMMKMVALFMWNAISRKQEKMT